jgi:hypothetical protein
MPRKIKPMGYTKVGINFDRKTNMVSLKFLIDCTPFTKCLNIPHIAVALRMRAHPPLIPALQGGDFSKNRKLPHPAALFVPLDAVIS